MVLASLVTSYPDEVQKHIHAELGKQIPYLLLCKEDLEKGHREKLIGTLTGSLRFQDLIPIPFPERPRQKADKPRTINMRWGLYTQETKASPQ